MEESQTFRKIVSQIVVHPEKLIYVCEQDEIFADLQSTQGKIEIVAEKAGKGDFVLCRLTGRGGIIERSLCIGKKVDPELDEIIEGHGAGEQIELEYEGRRLLVEIVHVKRLTQFDVENGDFKELHIEGVRTREDYMEQYVNMHHEELARKAVNKIFSGIERQYVNNALKLKDGVTYSEAMLADYAKRARENQVKMLDSYFGGDQSLLEQTLETNFHRGSREANERAFEEETKRAYLRGIAAKDVMTELGCEVKEEEYEATVQASAGALHMREEDYRNCCSIEDYRMSVYGRNLQAMLLDEFVKRVQVKIKL